MAKISKIAHRGFSQKYPENSITAFTKAIEYGADMIELDVHLSSDNVPVVIHDDTIDRTSDGSGAVLEYTYDELSRYSFHNGMDVFLGERLPRLEEVLDICKGKVELNIELKNCPTKYEGLEARVIEAVDRVNFKEGVIISSFDHFSLKRIKGLKPEIRIGMLYSALWLSFEQEIEELDVYSIHPAIDVVDKSQCCHAKETGRQVYVWVALDRKTVDYCISSGYVDGIMVNDLSLF